MAQLRERDVILRIHETFRANRQLTVDLLRALSAADLERMWQRPGLNTFAKHFVEIAAVERAFAAAIASGVMDFSDVPEASGPDGVRTAEQLEVLLEEADAILERQLSLPALPDVIDWDGMKLALDQHLVNLVSHEIFHQGQMALALYCFCLSVPDSWRQNWALPPGEG
jgi:uncharacterized damage-inducible protein DinB